MNKIKFRTHKVLTSITALVLALTMCMGCGASNDIAHETLIDPIIPGTTTNANNKNESISPTTTVAMTNAPDYAVAEGTMDLAEVPGRYFDYGNFNTEEYNSITETGFLNTLTNPLSTFSADVDTASYTNIRRMLNEGTFADGEAIRLEEFLNYFSYDYNAPAGDAPFGVTTELADCPWNKDSKLLLIGLAAEQIDLETKPASNFVFLLDVSGSMYSANKLPLMQKAFSMLVEELDENDRVSIVTYAGHESVILEGVKGNETLKITAAIENLEAGGSTAGAAGITKAYEIAERYFIKGGNNRIILATDGDLNVGVSSESALTKLVTEKRKSGVYLSVLGFGTGNIKDNKMEALADNGNGNYSYIDSIFEAKKVLVNEMGGTLYTVAKDVKFQIEFNPAKVAKYRLIGYENRRLEDYEFNDDTVDAGEIGAGHNVTAVYELILEDGDKNLSASEYSLKYQTAVLTDSDDLLTLKIRYKEPDGDTSKLLEYPVLPSVYSQKMSDNLKFAASVIEFGMLLRGSIYKGTSSYANVLTMLSELGSYVNDDPYKDEFRELVKIADKNKFMGEEPVVLEKSQSIRTTYTGATSRAVIIVNSYDELKTYYNHFEEECGLQARDKVYSDTTIGFATAIEKYDEEWFSKHSLAMVRLTAGSGSIRYTAAGLTNIGGAEYIIVDEFTPEVGTCDMAEWHLLSELTNVPTICGIYIRNSNGAKNVIDCPVYSVKEAIANLTLK